MRTLIVLPTFNEADNIVEVLQKLRAVVPEASVLVVDDASPDGTADLVEEVAEQIGDVSVMRRPAKSGLGSAYRDGFRRGLSVGYDVMVEMDSDLSHDPAALPCCSRLWPMVRLLRSEAGTSPAARSLTGPGIAGRCRDGAIAMRLRFWVSTSKTQPVDTGRIERRR